MDGINPPSWPVSRDSKTAKDRPTPMPLRIPHHELPRDTLDALIEEFVTRDGTNPADAFHSVEQVKKLLDAGHVVITFDEDTETCTLLRKEEADRQGV